MSGLFNMAQLGIVLFMPLRPDIECPSVEIDGTKLRTLRKLRGETLEDFAARCDISYGYLGQIERGTRPNVGPRNFVRICDALEIPAADRIGMVRTRPVKQRARVA